MKTYQQAKAEHEDAARAMINAVEREYPIGNKVHVVLGGHNLTIEITGHQQSWWHDPGKIWGA